MARAESGFTRLEFAVGAAIAATAVGLLLPAVQKLREAQNRTVCIKNIGDLGRACRSFHDARGTLPPGGNQTPPATSACLELPCREKEWSWAYHILPFLGHEETHENAEAGAVQSAVIDEYYCPSRRKPQAFHGHGMLDYAGNAGPTEGGASGAFRRTSDGPLSYADFSDSVGSTVLIAEKRMNVAELGTCPADANGYATPGWNDRYEAHRLGIEPPAADFSVPSDQSALGEFGSSHPGLFNAVFADGSVRTIRFTVSPATWRRACGRNDKGMLNLNDL